MSQSVFRTKNNSGRQFIFGEIGHWSGPGALPVSSFKDLSVRLVGAIHGLGII